MMNTHYLNLLVNSVKSLISLAAIYLSQRDG